MKLVRYGPPGKEKPGLIDADGNLRDLSRKVKDIDADTLGPAKLKELSKLDVKRLPLVKGKPRLGPCVTGVSKFVAIGLNYIAIDPYRALAETLEISDGAQATPDQPLYFVRSSANLAARRFAADALLGRARQHAVLGGDPTLAAVAQKRRHTLFEFGCADYSGIAHLDQYRTVGGLDVARRNL